MNFETSTEYIAKLKSDEAYISSIEPAFRSSLWFQRCRSLHPDQTVSMEDPSRVIEGLERTYSAIFIDNTWCLRNVARCGTMLAGDGRDTLAH